jgi:hypothetical protein
MRIIFAEPPIKKKKLQPILPQTHPYMGILYLISYVREQIDGIQISYLEGNLTINEHISRVQEIKPDLYFLSFTSFLSNLSFEVIKKIKNDNSAITIICGGSQPTINPEEVLQNGADICVIGEGEITVYELVKHYINEADTNLSSIFGIVYKNDGKIFHTQKRPLIKNLDSIPFPAWDLVDMKKYTQDHFSKSHPRANIIVSRGCPYNCNFCSNPVWKVNIPWLRLRSPENIAEEIQYLYNIGIREIYLYGDEFNPVPKWSIAVCKEIKKLGYDDLFFQTILHVNKVNDDLSKALKDINCWLVKIGIESGNQSTLDKINKKITLEQVRDACKSLKKYDIKIFGFFMAFHIWEENGHLCHETPEETINTLDFAHDLLANNLIDYISWGFTTPIPGSQLYETCLKYNAIDPKFKMSKWDKTLVHLDIDNKVMQSIKRKGMLLQARYNIINGLRDCGLRYINISHWLTKLIHIMK